MIRKLAEGDGPVAGGDTVSRGFSRGSRKWRLNATGGASVGGGLALLWESWELLHTLAQWGLSTCCPCLV